MSVRSFIILFLILFVTLSLVSASDEPLHVFIGFPDFYETNVTATNCCKNIGLVGINYTGAVLVGAPRKEVNLTNRFIQLSCSHQEEKKLDTDRVFSFNTIECFKLDSYRFNLSDELNETLLRKGEYKNFSFTIFFYQTGLYDLRWKEKEESKWSVRLISIVEPIDYEQLTKQTEVSEAENKNNSAIFILIGILSVVVTIAIFAIPKYLEWRKRPKLELEPWVLKPDSDTRLLGFIVKNRGLNTAKNVNGEVDRNHGSSIPIMWYNQNIMQGTQNVANAILSTNIKPQRKTYFYHFYIAIMKKSKPIKLCDKVITIKLNWDYKDDMKFKNYKFPCDIFSKML